MASVFARFHFRPHFLQHSGFRLVHSHGKAPVTKLSQQNFLDNNTSGAEKVDDDNGNISNDYESPSLLNMYLGLHFPNSGSNDDINPILEHPGTPNYCLRFPQRVAKLLISLCPERSNGRVLDIGCSVGGSSFELAKHFDAVEAFDFRLV